MTKGRSILLHNQKTIAVAPSRVTDLSVVRRTMNPTALNAVANHPEVRPWLGGDGPVDLSDIIGNPLNVALETEGGGFACVYRGAGVYEAHSLFVPSARSSRSIVSMRDGMDYLFTRTDCTDLVTIVPDGNPAAAALAKLGHFSKRFRRESGWQTQAGMVGADYYGLTLQSWALINDTCRDAGQAFHRELEAAKASVGSTLPAHEDDPAHDRMAGACYRMAAVGNHEKAVTVYNQWAVVAGYAQIALLTGSPPIIDIQDAVVEVRDGAMEVLKCL